MSDCTSQHQKNEFLQNEIIFLTFLGGFQHAKIYKESTKEKHRGDVKIYIRNELKKLNEIYKNPIDEEAHIKNIIKFADKLSNKFPDLLVNNRFRIGISQKIINLYLKYIWTLGLIGEPPHCPFDSIIINEMATKGEREVRDIRFTKMDSEKDYRKLITAAKVVSSNEGCNSIAEWELNVFERREV